LLHGHTGRWIGAMIDTRSPSAAAEGLLVSFLRRDATGGFKTVYMSISEDKAIWINQTKPLESIVFSRGPTMELSPGLEPGNSFSVSNFQALTLCDNAAVRGTPF